MIFYSIRVVEAKSRSAAIKKIERGIFNEKHPLCDEVVPAMHVLIAPNASKKVSQNHV